MNGKPSGSIGDDAMRCAPRATPYFGNTYRDRQILSTDIRVHKRSQGYLAERFMIPSADNFAIRRHDTREPFMKVILG